MLGAVGNLFKKLWTLGEFIKFSHTIFALPFALSAMVVAARENRGFPGWRIFLLILAAMVCARTCAMSFNRIVDRRFDAQNPRTATRHLPSGKISLTAAWTLCLASGVGLIITSYFINNICFYLSPVALFVVCFYSLTKRFTNYSHFYLGIALALAPIGAWLAVRGLNLNIQDISGMAILGTAVVFWLVGFDIIYAIQDYEFDKSHGLRSLVVAWGPKNALIVSFLAHVLMWFLLGLFGLIFKFRFVYAGGLLIILICLVIEHFLARKRTIYWINIAFFRLNALISIVFFVIVAAEVVFERGFVFKIPE
ncbi:MAG: putative 4-hydroxybenzoate polyprenyltransferase [Verrucomicrobiae bacterium]|nr:putative 4-hydroxybenzoate polyprenyltransferase [Verrucomicrobiae bacterium]